MAFHGKQEFGSITEGMNVAKINRVYESEDYKGEYDINLVFEIGFKGTTWTRDFAFRVKFEKDTSGNIIQKDKGLRKAYKVLDYLHVVPPIGFNEKGDWVTEEGSPVKDPAGYLNAKLSTRDFEYEAWNHKEESKKNGKTYDKIYALCYDGSDLPTFVRGQFENDIEWWIKKFDEDAVVAYGSDDIKLMVD